MDNARELQQQVIDAYAGSRSLRIRGGGSKDFYGFAVQGELLSTTGHTGIIDYQPTELVITARAGTPLQEIEAALAEHNQMLGCEPPHFGEQATYGGMIAAGLSGPRRPFAGSIADQVLGCRIINGRGEIMQFGGKVMKNVAGYDLSRLLVGSLGCLAVILDATVRLVPRPAAERTYRFRIAGERQTAFINQLLASGFPLSASCHDGQHLIGRFSAGAREIAGLEEMLHQRFDCLADVEDLGEDYWQALREQRTAFFQGNPELWRLSLAPDTRIDLPGTMFFEWNGAQRWLRTDAQPDTVFNVLRDANGSATLFRTREPATAESLFQPLSPALLKWHRQLKDAFDPMGLFNPGRMYREF